MISREQVQAVQQMQEQAQQAYAVTVNAQAIAILQITADYPDKEKLQRVCVEHLITAIKGA